ncbi:hypothetical protein ISS96_02075 [Candidatus Bathyarchaeota archaeon]|nr:hypothetical protein [Candidatus Bathyarchaeota archaeon]
MTLDYKAMLDRILSSEYAEAWIEEREANLESEKRFYGRLLSEKEWQKNLISNFCHQDLPEIVRVLPELWTEIEVEVKHTLTYDILRNPESLEQNIRDYPSRSYVAVPFHLGDFLTGVENSLSEVLEKRRREG